MGFEFEVLTDLVQRKLTGTLNSLVASPRGHGVTDQLMLTADADEFPATMGQQASSVGKPP
jgi:hypothetical protein